MDTPADPRRSPLGLVLGVALTLAGIIFMGQGLGILTAGTSPMIGDPKWAVIGAGCVILGVALAWRARARR